MRTLQEFDNPVVIDDGSKYDCKPFLNKCEYHRGKHVGKEFFWATWDYAFKLCKESNDEYFYFFPDDWMNYDLSALESIIEGVEEPFAFNYANLGRGSQWTTIKHHDAEFNGYKCIRNSFVDCAFVTNRKTMQMLDWEMYPVDPDRFRNPYISSGVGQQISRRLHKLDIPMYKPFSSLCEQQEGAFNSQMNTEERKRNPTEMI